MKTERHDGGGAPAPTASCPIGHRRPPVTHSISVCHTRNVTARTPFFQSTTTAGTGNDDSGSRLAEQVAVKTERHDGGGAPAPTASCPIGHRRRPVTHSISGCHTRNVTALAPFFRSSTTTGAGRLVLSLQTRRLVCLTW